MIEVQNLTKRYGDLVAVDDVSFTAKEGEVLGFLGPNGAGKTTTMRIITGFMPATSGSVSLVVANHTLAEVDDLGRQLRQVHRVLKASHPFVLSMPHPFAGVHSNDEYGSKVLPYGTVGRTIGEWHMHLSRANFLVDHIVELGVSEISPVPTTLVLRARKEGD